MSARFSITASIASVLFLCPIVVLAQADLVPQAENSNFAFSGLTNGTTFIRSGPGESYYPCLKLSKGSPLTIVGHKFDWLKVLPPEGSFCYVAQQYVDKSADGTTGTIKAGNVNVRAGSKLNPLKTAVQCQLNTGDKVTILSEADEYYMIKPPPEAFFYVSQSLVDPVKQLDAQPAGNTIVVAQGPTTQPTGQLQLDWAPSTRPAQLAAAEAKPDTDRASAETEFDRLETTYRSLSGPIEQQPLPLLLTGYEKLAKNEHLPTSMLRIVEQRLPYLRARSATREEVVATMRRQEELRQKTAQAAQERSAQEQKMKSALEIFAAVGRIEASVVQPGGGTLYRVTDPANGRTYCYVRSSDSRYPMYIGKFVGIKGELRNDATLSSQVVEATETTEIDPARVNKNVTARIIPPSLLRGGTDAITPSGGR